MLTLSIDEVSSLVSELCEEFQDLGKQEEAAETALKYWNDVESAINSYRVGGGIKDWIFICHGGINAILG